MNIDYLSNLVITNVDFISDMYSSEGVYGNRQNRARAAIIVKYEGETLYKSNGREFISNINHIAVLPKGSSYEWRCLRAGHYFVLEFDTADTSSEIFTVSAKNAEMILKKLKEARAIRYAADYTRCEAIRDALNVVLMLMQNESPAYTPTAKQKKIAPALDYIEKNYRERIKNEDLAHVCGISCVYFRKLFREVMGTSPIEYVSALKIEQAQEMLRGDCGSISDVSGALGYESIYDFSRAFKKRVGISPREFKSSNE